MATVPSVALNFFPSGRLWGNPLIFHHGWNNGIKEMEAKRDVGRMG